MLEQDDLSFDEKKYIIDQMLEVESRVEQKDTENKKHWLKIISLASAVIITCIGGLAAVLGANSGMSLPNLSSDNTDDMDNDYDDYE